MFWRTLLFCLIAALPLRAEEVVAGLSQARVAITTGFKGSEILVFGAVKRESAIPDEDLHVIVTVAGPGEPVTIRKKDRQFGIWVNVEAADLENAPSFYAVATTAPLADILEDTEDTRYQISVERQIRSTGAFQQVKNAPAFREALVRIKTGQDQYQLREGAVTLDESTLFRTAIKLPANLTEGDYAARIFLTRAGQVIDEYTTTIGVRKVGLERWIYTLAHEMPLIYGLMSLAVAIAAGWGASAVFRLIRT